MTDWEKLKQNVARGAQARKDAKEAFEFIRDLIPEDRFNDRFIEILVEYFQPAVKPESEPIRPMDDVEARRFEKRKMEFGKHQGVAMGDVPFDYLEWLSDSQRESSKEITRYLKSDRAKNANKAAD